MTNQRKYMVVLGSQCLGRNFDTTAQARKFVLHFKQERSGYDLTDRISIVEEPAGMCTGEYPVLTDGVWHRP